MMLCSMLYKEVILLCFLPILVLAKVLLHILFPGIITFAKSCCLVSGFSLQVFFNIILTLSLPMHIIILDGLTNIIICDLTYISY